MRKFTKLFMGLSLPITPIACTLPLVSCGNKEMLNITIHKGANVMGYKLYGDLFKGKDFKIQFTFDDGWEKIDEYNTEIKCGDKELELNQDYVIENDDTISVHGSSINNANITINIEAGKTLNKNSLQAEWKNIGTILFVFPNEKITTDDLDVWGYLGDDEEQYPAAWKPIEYGIDEGHYTVACNGVILQDFGTEGYTFKYEKPESELPTVEKFNILIDYGNGYTVEDLMVGCSVPVKKDDFKIKNRSPLTLNVGGDAWIEVETNPGASKMVTWSIEEEVPDESGKQVATIGKWDGRVIAENAGTCSIKATCIEDSTITATMKLIVNNPIE